MKQNIGDKDKLIRVVVGLILVYLGWKVSIWFYFVAVIAFVTAAIGFCGLYQILKIDTTQGRTKAKKKK